MSPPSQPLNPVHDPLPNLEDFQLAQRCLDGDPGALFTLQNEYRPQLIAYLVGAGAEPAEAEEIVEFLWADTVVAAPGEIPRLARYDGSCKLTTWLNTVAMNRFLCAIRRRKRMERYFVSKIGEETTEEVGEFIDGVPAPELEPPDQPLVDLLRGAIEAAFSGCTAEEFVLLQLAHGDGLRLVELGQIWGCTPSTISRKLKQAGEEVERLAMAYVRMTDPYLEITWQDFLQLCRTANLGALGFD